jgi:hypothetical protein
MRYRDHSVEARVPYEDMMDGRVVYADGIEIVTGNPTADLAAIIERVIRANYFLGAARVEAADKLGFDD